MRDLAKKERLLECVQGCHRDTLEILQLDVTNPASVASAIQRVPEQHVDVLGEPCPAGPLLPPVAASLLLPPCPLTS